MLKGHSTFNKASQVSTSLFDGDKVRLHIQFSGLTGERHQSSPFWWAEGRTAFLLRKANLMPRTLRKRRNALTSFVATFHSAMIRAFAAGVAPARLAGRGTALRSHVMHEMASVCTIRHACQGAFQGRGLHARAVARTLGQPVSKANKVRSTPSRIPKSYFYSTANTRAHHGSFSVLGRGSARTVTPFQQTRAMSNALTRFAGNFSVDSSNKVVYAIVAINVAVFATWQYAEANAQRFRDGRLYYFMFRNFTDSAQNLREGRVWTLVTSAFSHKEWYHIILNTMVLLSFGDPVSLTCSSVMAIMVL